LAINAQRGNRIIVIDIIFATSFSDLFRIEINCKILPIDRDCKSTFSKCKQFTHEKIRDHIMNMMRLAFVSELSQRAVTDITFYLEISTALKTLKSVRRMFDASSSYLFSVVLQLVDEEKIVGPNGRCVIGACSVFTLKTFIRKAF
jgi:hypothetical protein